MTHRRTGEHLLLDATETSRNITVRVIERDISGEIYYSLEYSRGFRSPKQSPKSSICSPKMMPTWLYRQVLIESPL
ncbi:hypothetical protein TNCV_3509161 [Trichonephila clavipes]|nr:hypothetical protein TNCV_3509161 [Trichonephila clavipes]